MQLNSVVLPAPLGPMMPTISHSPACSVTFCNALTPPKWMLTSSTSSTDIADLHLLHRTSVDVEPAAKQPLPDWRDLLADTAREPGDRQQQQNRADNNPDEVLWQPDRSLDKPLQVQEFDQLSAAHQREECGPYDH